MADQRLVKLARILVHYSTRVKKGELVSISGSTLSVPLVKEIYREVLRVGAHPRSHLLFEDQQHLFFSLAREHQLDYTDPLQLREMEEADVLISVFPDLNPRALSGIDPEKKQRAVRARGPITDMLTRRWVEGKLRWVGTAYPSAPLAQEAGMSLEEYTEFVFGAMRLNDEDPETFWREFSGRQETICKRLDKISEMCFVGEDTDLSFSCRGRTWVNCDGKNNFPDGEVFTGPVEDSVEGKIRFSFPGIFQGEEIEDIRLEFRKGTVTSASAAKGEALLTALIHTDEGAARAGEIAIGTNANITRFSKHMLFDEKIGGTVHLALGRGLPQSGSRNTSAIHWDMLMDMRREGEIYGDGQLIYEKGKFLFE